MEPGAARPVVAKRRITKRGNPRGDALVVVECGIRQCPLLTSFHCVAQACMRHGMSTCCVASPNECTALGPDAHLRTECPMDCGGNQEFDRRCARGCARTRDTGKQCEIQNGQIGTCASGRCIRAMPPCETTAERLRGKFHYLLRIVKISPFSYMVFRD